MRKKPNHLPANVCLIFSLSHLNRCCKLPPFSYIRIDQHAPGAENGVTVNILRDLVFLLQINHQNYNQSLL